MASVTASDAQDGDNFGLSLASSPDLAVVGAQTKDCVGGSPYGCGAAYVFQRNDAGPGGWGETEKLTASDAQGEDWFGASLAITGDVILVGAPSQQHGAHGAVYVFGTPALGHDGDPCSASGSCTTGHCVDGVCCDADCQGGDPEDCWACSVAAGAAIDGTCGPRQDGAICRDGTCRDGACEPGSGGGAPCGEGASAVLLSGRACGCRLGSSTRSDWAGPTLALGALAFLLARRRWGSVGWRGE